MRDECLRSRFLFDAARRIHPERAIISSRNNLLLSQNGPLKLASAAFFRQAPALFLAPKRIFLKKSRLFLESKVHFLESAAFYLAPENFLREKTEFRVGVPVHCKCCDKCILRLPATPGRAGSPRFKFKGWLRETGGSDSSTARREPVLQLNFRTQAWDCRQIHSHHVRGTVRPSHGL